VRQLKNITEQISIIENEREIGASNIRNYLPDYGGIKLPAVIKKEDEKSFSSEREILYKILFEMKSDMNDLKKLVFDLIRRGEIDVTFHESDSRAIKNLFREAKEEINNHEETESDPGDFPVHKTMNNIQDTEEIIEESLSLADKEVEMIKKALGKYNGKRKMAAGELGISERTLYRKIKEYGIES
jgi:DNA-binding NtrC family response regulator